MLSTWGHTQNLRAMGLRKVEFPKMLPKAQDMNLFVVPEI